MTRVTSNKRVVVAESTLPPLPPLDAASMLANTILRLGEYLQATKIAVAVVPVGRIKTDLASSCMDRNHRFTSPEHRRIWIAGRIAIRAARRRLGLSTGISEIQFPNACTSLTHIAGFAVSVTVPEGTLKGIGIDLEVRRMTTSRIERFFLTDAERAAIDRRPTRCRSDDRVRLWTTKEAIFKAYPDNRSLCLTSFEVEDPTSDRGRAVCRLAASTDRNLANSIIRYASEWTPVGCITLATMPAPRTLNPFSAYNLCRTARVSPEIAPGLLN